MPYSSATTHPSIPEVADATTSETCPAQNFSSFVDAFAESAAIQRRYTRIPLEYGHLNTDLIGTLKEDKAFSTRTINSFEAVPSFDRKDGGRIFRSKKKRLERGLEIRIGPSDERETNSTIATIFLPDSGFHVEYRFVKTTNCWILVGIDDRST
jgi:hypothetical protein